MAATGCEFEEIRAFRETAQAPGLSAVEAESYGNLLNAYKLKSSHFLSVIHFQAKLKDSLILFIACQESWRGPVYGTAIIAQAQRFTEGL